VLDKSICIRSEDEDDSADPATRISEVQVVAPTENDSKIEAAMRSLIGLPVRVDFSAAQSQATGHDHRPLVAWVSGISPLEQPANGAVISRSLAPVAYSASQAAEIGTAATTVRGFYYALGQGNGRGANDFIIPEKRGPGPYSIESIDHFYGPLPEPLSLIGLQPQGSNAFLVTYTFGTATRHCQGRAIVTTTQRERLNLIEKIRPLEDCGAPTSHEKLPTATAGTSAPLNHVNNGTRSAGGSPSPTEVASTPVRMDPRHPLRIGEDYYPDASKRANEEGRCIVEVTVAPDGHIATEAVQASTGFPRLDEACLRAVHGQRMFPATENGTPIQATVAIPIVWTLTNK
jgi:TonB family protein